MVFVFIVAVVHDQHHHGTSEEEQVRQPAEQMRSMLGEQEEGGHGTKAESREPSGGSPE